MPQVTFNGTKINVEFTESSSRQQLNSGENISTLFGKIKKIFSDLKAVCFSGSYNDLSNKPSSLPANGGNADTVGGKSASDFVGALTSDQIANTRILIPNNVDVVDWLIKNAKIGSIYYLIKDSIGQTNLPPLTGWGWAWFSFDGNRYFCRVMLSESNTIDYILDNVNYFGGWKEISTTPIKKMTFPSVATNVGGGGNLFLSDFGTPITIACTSRTDTQCTPFFVGNQWLVLAKDAVTLDPIPAGSYSFDVWYI